MNIEKYAVIGNPIAHSKSPLIHQAFASQFDKQISYEKVLAPLDGFTTTIERLQAEDYRGANVTVPFKFEAYQLSQRLSARAKATGAGAVNTLSFLQNGMIHGDNTDGVGLRNDIEKNLGVSVTDKNILLLGAGGAAQGVLNALIGTKSVTVANRTQSKALEMVSSVYDILEAHAVEYQELSRAFDLVINATSAGLTDSALPLPDCIFSSDTLAYDMMYGRETPFMQQARKAGASVADGLGMLVEQAAEAFYLWHGLRPETSPVIAAIRQQQ